MTFDSRYTTGDETSIKPLVITDVYHYKVHEGWSFDVSVSSQTTDMAYMTFCTPKSIDSNIDMHMLVDFSGDKQSLFEIWEGIIPPVQAPILATAMVLGTSYVILTKGTTDFMASGSKSNQPGTAFKANGAGVGTGTVLSSLTEGNKKNRLVDSVRGEPLYEFANKLKSHMNNHASDITQHGVADTINFPVTTPNATDSSSLLTLVAALQTAYISHHSDAKLVAAWVNHIGQFLGVTGDMIRVTAPTDTGEAAFIVEELQRKFNIHDNSAISHTVPGVSSYGKLLGGPMLTSQSSISLLATALTSITTGDRFTILLPGTTDYTLLGAEDSLVGTVFTHNGTIGLGTGTVYSHFGGLFTSGITIADDFTGGEQIGEEFTSKGGTSSSVASHERILKKDTFYGIRLKDPALNVNPLGFKIIWFEVPEK